MVCKLVALTLFVLPASFLSGCALIQKMSDPEDGEFTAAGPSQLLFYDDAQNFERVDLLALLDPPGAEGYKNLTGTPGATQRALATAYSSFYRQNANGSGIRARNGIQEAILGASDQRCSSYLKHLRLAQSGSNAIFGSATTILGGLGAIFTQADVARILSGSAGISSGINAEYNQAMFSNLAIHVIAPGIESRREEIYGNILKAREQDLNKYPVEAAVRDAVRYHAACSIVTGVEAASDAVKTVRDPGLSTALATVEKAQQLREMLIDPKGATSTDVPEVVQALKKAVNAQAIQSDNSSGVTADTLLASINHFAGQAVGTVADLQGRMNSIKASDTDIAVADIESSTTAFLKALSPCDVAFDPQDSAKEISLSTHLTLVRTQLATAAAGRPKLDEEQTNLITRISLLEGASHKRGQSVVTLATATIKEGSQGIVRDLTEILSGINDSKISKSDLEKLKKDKYLSANQKITATSAEINRLAGKITATCI